MWSARQEPGTPEIRGQRDLLRFREGQGLGHALVASGGRAGRAAWVSSCSPSPVMGTAVPLLPRWDGAGGPAEPQVEPGHWGQPALSLNPSSASF